MEKEKRSLGWLVYKEEDVKRNERFIGLLQKASELNKIKLIVKRLEEIKWHIERNSSPFTSEEPEFVINRSVSPWLNELCELFQIRVFNSAFVARIANDKRLTYAYARSKNIPSLETVTISKSELERGKGSLPFPYVVKDPYSRGGKAVFKITKQNELSQALTELPNELLIQPLAGNIGKDLRVYIVGNEIIAAILRESTHEDEFRANISTGGSSSLYHLSKEEKSIVECFMEGIQLDFVGLDFLFSKTGQLLFNEMEDAVGCRSLYMNSDMNIALDFLNYIKKVIAFD